MCMGGGDGLDGVPLVDGRWEADALVSMALPFRLHYLSLCRHCNWLIVWYYVLVPRGMSILSIGWWRGEVWWRRPNSRALALVLFWWHVFGRGYFEASALINWSMVDNILVWCGSWSTRDNKGPAADDLYVSCDIYILFVCPVSPVMIYHGRGSCICIHPWIRVVSHLFEDGIIPFWRAMRWYFMVALFTLSCGHWIAWRMKRYQSWVVSRIVLFLLNGFAKVFQ